MSAGEELRKNAAVAAGLLLRGPFPSLYVLSCYGDEVHFQCRELAEAQVRAARWRLDTYCYRMNEKGGEFHQWSGLVRGVRVEITATPSEPVGPLDSDAFTEFEDDPEAALIALADENTHDAPLDAGGAA